MITDKIIKNVTFSIISRFWGIGVHLWLTPFIITHIGVERYGIFALVAVLNGYFGLLDFAMGTSFVKYIAEYYTKKEYDKINIVINTGFVFYSFFAACIIFFAFVLLNPLLEFFKIPPSLQRETFLVFILGIIIFTVTQALSPFKAIYNGLQRLDISNKVDVAMTIPLIIGAIYFLKNGYGLPGLMVNSLIILCIRIIIIFIIGYKLFPGLRVNPLLFNKVVFKKLFNFGYKLQISRLANLVSFQTDKLLITYFLGIGGVVFYQLGSTIVMYIRQAILLFIPALIPAVSEIEAKKNNLYLRKLY